MQISENKKDELKIDGSPSINVDMAQAKIELAILKYKVVVERDMKTAEQKKKVRL